MAADAVREGAGDRATSIGIASRAGSVDRTKRREPLDGLKELRDEEDRAEHAEETSAGWRRWPRERPVAEEAPAASDVRAQLPRDEAHQHSDADDERTDMPGEVQPTSLARTSPRRSRRGRRWQKQDRQIERDNRSAALLQPQQDQRCERQPIGTFSQKIQCQRSADDDRAADQRPGATARPLMPPQMPSARPRRSADTEADRIVSVNGITIAPPRP